MDLIIEGVHLGDIRAAQNLELLNEKVYPYYLTLCRKSR